MVYGGVRDVLVVERGGRRGEDRPAGGAGATGAGGGVRWTMRGTSVSWTRPRARSAWAARCSWRWTSGMNRCGVAARGARRPLARNIGALQESAVRRPPGVSWPRAAPQEVEERRAAMEVAVGQRPRDGRGARAAAAVRDRQRRGDRHVSLRGGERRLHRGPGRILSASWTWSTVWWKGFRGSSSIRCTFVATVMSLSDLRPRGRRRRPQGPLGRQGNAARARSRGRRIPAGLRRARARSDWGPGASSRSATGCGWYPIEPEITARVLQAGFRIRELPVAYNPRRKDEGKKISWTDGIDAIYTLLRCRLIAQRGRPAAPGPISRGRGEWIGRSWQTRLRRPGSVTIAPS